MIWFTADTHFKHQLMLDGERFSPHRPWSTPEEMDHAIIAMWNARVKPGDRVYHLGDVCCGHHSHISDYWDQLNGEKWLIIGNHDEKRLRAWFKRGADQSRVTHYKKVKLQDPATNQVHKVILSHYAMRVWDCSHYGAIHLYGHSHGKLTMSTRCHLCQRPHEGSMCEDPTLSMDVGMDAKRMMFDWSDPKEAYTPWSWPDILTLMKSRRLWPRQAPDSGGS